MRCRYVGSVVAVPQMPPEHAIPRVRTSTPTPAPPFCAAFLILGTTSRFLSPCIVPACCRLGETNLCSHHRCGHSCCLHVYMYILLLIPLLSLLSLSSLFFLLFLLHWQAMEFARTREEADGKPMQVQMQIYSSEIRSSSGKELVSVGGCGG